MKKSVLNLGVGDMYKIAWIVGAGFVFGQAIMNTSKAMVDYVFDAIETRRQKKEIQMIVENLQKLVDELNENKNEEES